MARTVLGAGDVTPSGFQTFLVMIADLGLAAGVLYLIVRPPRP
jgi:hypothetical protein